MLNSEHYPDPTASKAVGRATKKSKKKWESDPAYIAEVNRRNADFASRVSEMTLEEIKTKLKNCAKCNGDAFVCVGCVEDKGGCIFGKRAVELLDNMTKAPDEVHEKKVAAGRKGAQMVANAAMMKYKAALESGDPIQYIISNSRMTGDDTKKLYQARATLKRWERDYGSLIQKTTVAKEPDPAPKNEPVLTEETPHLMQMPCLSKKMAAERAEKTSIKQVFCTKLEDLQKACDEVQAKIDELLKQKEKYAAQIEAMMTTAECLEIAI